MGFELLESLCVLAYLSLGGGGIRVANKLFIAHPANITWFYLSSQQVERKSDQLHMW